MIGLTNRHFRTIQMQMSNCREERIVLFRGVKNSKLRQLRKSPQVQQHFIQLFVRKWAEELADHSSTIETVYPILYFNLASDLTLQ